MDLSIIPFYSFIIPFLLRNLINNCETRYSHMQNSQSDAVFLHN